MDELRLPRHAISEPKPDYDAKPPRKESFRIVRRVSATVMDGFSNLYRRARSPSIMRLRDDLTDRYGYRSGRMKSMNAGPPISPLRPMPPIDEKRFLEAAERGDKSTIDCYLETGIDVNCCDVLGRTALEIAVDNENVEIVGALLSQNGIQIGHSLLCAIREGVYTIVEMLIDHPSISSLSQGPQSILGDGWHNYLSKSDSLNFEYSPDITPIMFAAHLKRFEILKLLKDRGADIAKPHHLSCRCGHCEVSRGTDELRHSCRRLNAYKAMASPAWMSLMSTDPIFEAFRLSRELSRLASEEFEFKEAYQQLSEQCTNFACDVLSQCRSSEEVLAVLNRDCAPGADTSSDSDKIVIGSKISLARLKLAIKYDQKRFVAHPHTQQLLTSIWYEGFPARQERGAFVNYFICILLILAWPFLATVYIVHPKSRIGQIVRSPFMKFLYFSSSFGIFLFLLTLATLQDYQQLDPTAQFVRHGRVIKIVDNVGDFIRAHDRSPGFSVIEYFIFVWVIGMVWAEVKQLWEEGIKSYTYQWWNWMDFIMMSLYLTTFSLRLCAMYFGATGQLEPRNVPRSQWASDEPVLIAEGLFAIANVFSFSRILYLFQTSPYLGPLQISLGCMLVDILKFFLIFFLILTSFSVGLHQLYWYYDSAIRVLDSDLSCPPFDENCEENTGAFASISQSYITLIWSLFSITNIKDTQVRPNHHATEWIGKCLYIGYHLTSIIVFLNMLIAMMSSSFQKINENSDLEWKFHRSKLWMSYFDEGSSLSVPFNLVITPKSVKKALRGIYELIHPGNYGYKSRATRATIRRPGYNKRQKRQKSSEGGSRRCSAVPAVTYREIMERLVHRFIHMAKKENRGEGPCSEDDLMEIKQDISSLRYELRDDRRREIKRSTSHFDKVKQEIIRSMSQRKIGQPGGADDQPSSSLRKEGSYLGDYMRVPGYTPCNSPHIDCNTAPVSPFQYPLGGSSSQISPNVSIVSRPKSFVEIIKEDSFEDNVPLLEKDGIPEISVISGSTDPIPGEHVSDNRLLGVQQGQTSASSADIFHQGKHSTEISVQTAKLDVEKDEYVQATVRAKDCSVQCELTVDNKEFQTPPEYTPNSETSQSTFIQRSTSRNLSDASQPSGNFVRREDFQNFLNETLGNFKTQILADIADELDHKLCAFNELLHDAQSGRPHLDSGQSSTIVGNRLRDPGQFGHATSHRLFYPKFGGEPSTRTGLLSNDSILSGAQITPTIVRAAEPPFSYSTSASQASHRPSHTYSSRLSDNQSKHTDRAGFGLAPLSRSMVQHDHRTQIRSPSRSKTADSLSSQRRGSLYDRESVI